MFRNKGGEEGLFGFSKIQPALSEIFLFHFPVFAVPLARRVKLK